MSDSPPERFRDDKRKPWTKGRGLPAVLAKWESDGLIRDITLAEKLPSREGSYEPIPESLHPKVAASLRSRGLDSLYAHQARAFELATSGRDLVVATPTASGKSLCYNLPVLDALARDGSARALYMFPTKALARDQEEALRQQAREAGLEHGAITYDGDTPGDARRAARERSAVILTNPDMLHAGILPHHASWARFFANLKFVVIDELHTYRGVFGSHLANVLRRLDRVARFHGSTPVYLMASATIGNPEAHARRVIGRDVALVGESGAPTGSRRVVVYNPPVVNAELGVRASYLKTAVRLASDLIEADVPTIVFGQSRNGVETMLKYLRDRLARANIDPESIQGYRGGYLPETRRRIEAGLRSGDVRCVVSTNALELGIDIGSLDAVVCAGYPGSMAGLWQRFGRAGRRTGESIAVLVASSAPVDQYVALDPEIVLRASIEHARIDPDNVEILIQHLKCATFELPFDAADRFGDLAGEGLVEALDFLTGHQVVSRVPGSRGSDVYHWASDAYPASSVSLRTVGWDNFVVIELDGQKTIAEMDFRSTHTMLHEQAIYQHEGEQYQVERLDFDNHKAFVRKVEPDYYTTAMTHTKVSVLHVDETADVDLGGARLQAGLGEVSVVEKVVGYKKIKFHSHENVGYGDVHLPEMEMHTSSFWLTVPESFVEARPEPRATVIDALRGMSKAMHTVAAIGLMIDPRDLGRTLGDRSDPELPPGKGSGPGFDPTIFLYDQTPGGIGLAPRIFDEHEAMLVRTRALVAGCPCEDGCPSCIGPDAGLPNGEPAIDGRKSRVLSILSDFGVSPVH